MEAESMPAAGDEVPPLTIPSETAPVVRPPPDPVRPDEPRAVRTKSGREVKFPKGKYEEFVM